MELILQFGHGMMGHCRHLVERWGGGRVIMSPRDLDSSQLERFSHDIRALPGGRVWLDPQFYSPHADHERLCSHSYWPTTYDTNQFWDGTHLDALLESLLSYNERLGCECVLLPGLLASEVDDLWLASQVSVTARAEELAGGRYLIATVCLAAEIVRNEEQVEAVLEAAEHWPCSGIYLVVEPPSSEYFCDDANWLANVLDLIAGFKLLGKYVVLGYSGQQMLAASLAGLDGICSGTFVNVRQFSTDRFNAPEEGDISRRSKWYYCPRTFSEYKIPMLDIARRFGVLDDLATPDELNGGYADELFSGVQPTNVNISEQSMFRHYLYALHEQAVRAVGDSFNSTYDSYSSFLNDAEQLIASVGQHRISGQNREFRDFVDVNRTAVHVLRSTRGPMLSHHWQEFSQ